jgi:hypothetical protein
MHVCISVRALLNSTQQSMAIREKHARCWLVLCIFTSVWCVHACMHSCMCALRFNTTVESTSHRGITLVTGWFCVYLCVYMCACICVCVCMCTAQAKTTIAHQSVATCSSLVWFCVCMYGYMCVCMCVCALSKPRQQLLADLLRKACFLCMYACICLCIYVSTYIHTSGPRPRPSGKVYNTPESTLKNKHACICTYIHTRTRMTYTHTSGPRPRPSGKVYKTSRSVPNLHGKTITLCHSQENKLRRCRQQLYRKRQHRE